MASEEGLHFVATIDNKDFMRSITEIRDAVVKTSQLLEQVATNTGKAGKIGTNAAQETSRAVDRASDSARKLNKEIDNSSKGFQELAKYATGFFTLQAAKAFTEKIFAVRQEIESLQTSFRILVGDKDKADALFKGIKDFAVSTPMQMKDLASAAQTMMGFGIPLEQIMENLKAIGDVSMGDAQRFQGLALSFSQMSAAGKLMGQDLMQMINAGFNPLATISEKTGKSIGVLKDEMSKGAISADMVRQAFIDATSEGGKFHGMLEEQSKTLKGAYSNLQGAIDDMLNSLGEKMQGTFTSAIDAATYLAKNYETVGKVILTVVAAFGAYKAALMVIRALEISKSILGTASAFVGLAKEVTSAKDAMVLFNLVTKASPIGIVLSVVAAAAAAFALFGKSTSNAEKMEQRFNESTTKATANVKALYATLGTANKTSKVAADTTKELKNVAEEYGIKLSDEAKKLGNESKLVEELTAKREELIDAIRREAIERERANQQKEIEDEYAKRIQEARENFTNALSDDFSSQAKGLMTQLITDEDIERIGRVEAEIRRLRETHGKYSVEVAEKERERAAMTDELVKKLWGYSAELGKVEGNEAKYANTASNMKDAVVDFLRVTNESTVAQENAKVALANVTLATTKQISVQDAATSSADALHSRTVALIDLWNNAHPEMTFTVHFNDSEIPAWMKGMTTEELKRSLAARQQALQSGKNVRYGNRTFSKDAATAREAAMMDSIIYGREHKPAKTTTSTPTPTQTKTKPKKSSGKTSSWNQAHANADAKKLLEDWKEEMIDLLEDVQQDIDDANVEILEESTEKMLKKLDEDEKKELAAIQEKRKDLIKKRRELDEKLWEKSAEKHDQYNFNPKTDEEYLKMIEEEAPGLLGALEERSKQITKSVKKQREEILKEQAKQEREAMLAHLKEYGDIEQQKLAITQEYEEKIAQARKAGKSSYEIASLEMERNSQLNDLNTKSAEKRIDWTGVFSSLEGHTKQYLEGLRGQLQALLNEGNLPADQMVVVQEKLREINAAISEQSTMFDYIGERAREYNRLQQEAADAQAELNAALEEQAEAETNLQIAKFGVKRGMSTESDVIVAEDKLKQAREKTAKATAKAKDAEDRAARTSAQKIADTFKDAAEWVNTYLGDLPELLDKLGLGKAGEKAQMGINAVNDAAGAAADFASGNYVGAALKAFNALDNIGNIVGVGGLSDKNLASDIERLTASNQDLQKAIQNLADEMEHASMGEALEIYQTQLALLKQNTAQTQEIMRRSGAVYNRGFWGTGIGGRHSTNSKIDKGMTDAEWRIISRIAGTSVNSASAFWNLSQKQMHDIATYATSVWTHIKDLADEGTEDVAQYMEDYADSWKQVEELTDAINEKLTSTTFDSVYDEFVSMLSDMDSDSHSFAESFEKYMFNAILNQRMSEGFKKELEDWYDSFAKASEGGLTEEEIARLRESYVDLGKRGREIRDEVQRITGYGNTSEGSATYNAAKSFTQEQGDILNGRLTAIQIAVRENNVLSQQIAASLKGMESLTSMGTDVSEIRNMMIYTNSYLETVARYAKKTYDDFGEKMDRIILHTDTL